MQEFVVAKKACQTYHVIKAHWEAGLGKDIRDHLGRMFVYNYVLFNKHLSFSFQMFVYNLYLVGITSVCKEYSLFPEIGAQ